MTLKDGPILPDQAPPSWGFTSRRFEDLSYLWVENSKSRVLVSMIASRKAGKGYFRALVQAIRASGYTVAVPSPLGVMQRILTHWGYTKKFEPDGGTEVAVWSHDGDIAGCLPAPDRAPVLTRETEEAHVRGKSLRHE